MNTIDHSPSSAGPPTSKPPAARRILVITKGYARYRENLFRAMAQALGDEARVYHTTPETGNDLWEVDWEALLEKDAPIIHFNLPRIGISDMAAALARRISPGTSKTVDDDFSSLSSIAPDLVIIQEYSPVMIKAALYCRLRGIPCIVCSDLGLGTDWRQFPKTIKWLHRLGGHLTDGLIAHTQTARIPLSCSSRPRVFIPHSIDISPFPPSQGHATRGNSRVRLLMVGQYIPRKGHDLLAKAARRLIERGINNFEIRLVGTQDPTWLNSVIGKEKLEGHMVILGTLKGEALFDEFRQADLFILTSRFDTFAVVVHEAVAFGLPLLISKFAEASALLVSEGENGFVVDPTNTEELANRMEMLITHPETWESMGTASRRLGETVCASKTGRQLAEWLMTTPFNVAQRRSRN